ncbi:MAG: pyridoxal phosphate-dependent aminotransferase [Planctomycetes bacterium]|nr:pyridoxal phosphate-dependent aminotransferase [Planctomycetota bacterium]
MTPASPTPTRAVAAAPGSRAPGLSARALAIQASAIRKLDGLALEATRKGVQFHRLNIGQPDIPTPAPVREALAREDGPVLAYGPASGLPEYREALAADSTRRGMPLSASDVAVTTGGSEAILFALIAVADPGDDILVPEPYYTNYNGFATVAGVSVRPVPATLAEGFRIPSDEVLDRHRTERTRAFLFANPGNPTGAIYPREELERVAAWARRYGIFLIGDEVYSEIWFTGRPPSVLELVGAEDLAIRIDSVSKKYSSCGLRVGSIASRNQSLMERVERLGQARLGVGPRTQKAAQAALSLPDSYFAEVRRTYRERIDAMMTGLAAIPGARFHRPDGAFYTMAALPVGDAEDFARFLITDFRRPRAGSGTPESVIVAPGTGFYADPGTALAGEIRLAAVKEVAETRRAMALLGEAVNEYRSLRRIP